MWWKRGGSGARQSSANSLPDARYTCCESSRAGRPVAPIPLIGASVLPRWPRRPGVCDGGHSTAGRRLWSLWQRRPVSTGAAIHSWSAAAAASATAAIAPPPPPLPRRLAAAAARARRRRRRHRPGPLARQLISLAEGSVRCGQVEGAVRGSGGQGAFPQPSRGGASQPLGCVCAHEWFRKPWTESADRVSSTNKR